VTGRKVVSATGAASVPPTAGSDRVGVFGGTFDPPHIGHERAIIAFQTALNLDVVHVMVAGDPWQKTGRLDPRGLPLTPARHRLAMAERAFSGLPGVVVDDIEVRREGPTYSIDTLQALARPGRTLFLLLGADAAAGLAGWHRHAELPGLAELAVVDRAATSGGVALPDEVTRRWRTHLVAMDPVRVSSTEVRRRLADGEDLDQLVQPSVVAYAQSHGLYRERRDES
jgi:nicotinate-nucleotide adenylyltransferase